MVDLAQLGFEVDSDGVVVATENLDKMERSSKKAETASERLAKQAEATGKKMQKLGRTTSIYVTAPFLAAATASIKLGSDFDSTLTKMNTLVGVSRTEIAGFRKEILLLGPAVGKGPIELADALFAVTSAGQRGAQALDTLEKASKASALGLGNTRTVALAATAAVQAYGEANLNSTQSLEILIGTIEQGNVAAEQLAPVLGRVIGIAAELGVQFEDVGAFIAVFTRLGVDAAEATTSLRGVLSTIQKPTEEAEEAFSKMGTSVDELRRKIKDDGFINTFQEMVKLAKATGTDLATVVPNVRALSGVLGVFGGEGKIAQEVLEGVSAAVGTLEERFEAMKELDPSFAIKAMQSETQALFIDLSVDLLPIFLELIQTLRDTVKWFAQLSPETKTFAVNAGLAAAAVGPLLFALGGMARIFGTLLPLLLKLGFLLSPAGAIGLGLGLLVKLIGDIYVARLEAAISTTRRFTTSLEELKTAAGLQNNLLAVSENVNQFITDRENITRRIQDVQASLENMTGLGKLIGADDDAIAQLARLNAELETTDKNIESQIKLRDDYTQRLVEAILKEQEETEALKKLNDEFAEIGIKTDLEALQELLDLLDPTAKAMEELTDARKLLDRAFKNGDLEPEEWERWNAILDRSQLAIDALGDSLFKINSMDINIAADLEDSIAFVEGLEAIKNELDGLERVIDPAGAALKDLTAARDLLQEAFDNKIIDRNSFDALSSALEESSLAVQDLGDTFERAGQEWFFALNELSGLFERDSREAEALNTVIQGLNVVMGVTAVLKQLAAGDVYSAIPRALGVAALVASMGISTGASGSAGGRSAQDTQGTGSVLGLADEKTESILRATEITASATSELVGINRGMLHALQTLQIGIDGAVNQVARGTGADFGALPSVFKPSDFIDKLPLGIFGSIAGTILNKLFGGKSKLLDEGIRILGGNFNDLINDITVEAFQTVSVKKNIFSSTKIEDRFQTLGDEVSTQFGLVFDSIRDTVEQAAIALGIPLDVIQQRINDFEVATQTISLSGLDAEQQREELLAVFGEIFDDLALDVIPFIGQFQKVGEGLGETLVRVATSVQVFEEAVTQLGFVFDEVDPEMIAQAAVGLVDLVGGVENFISQFSTFIDKFASDEQKLEFATDQLTRAFDQAGLVIPETRDGFFELMQTLDAGTVSGREQIATLLRLADVADEYYSLLDDAEQERLEQAQLALEQAQLLRDQAQSIRDFIDIGPPSELIDLRRRFDEAMAAADSLGASQQEYAMIARSFDRQLQRMAAGLLRTIISLSQSLFGPDETEANNPVIPAIERTREVANSLFTDWIRALESIREFTDDILLDEQLSPLTPAERLSEAQSQFNDLLAAAQAGDADAAAALPAAAEALLDAGRFMFASGDQYQQLFDTVLAALQSIEMPDDIPETITEVISTGGGSESNPIEPEDFWSANLELLQGLNDAILAMDLAVALRDLSEVLGVSVLELADELGVPMRDLVELLGVELNNLTAETASALGGAAELLGANVLELAASIGLSIAELASAFGVSLEVMSQDLAIQLGEFSAALGANVFELADVLNISIEDLAATFSLGIGNFEASQFSALAAFSEALGTGITDVAEQLGISLGDITDATSLLSESLNLAIEDLPEGIQADLGPLLDAIREATTQADANNAIQDLIDFVNFLPPDIVGGLTPILGVIADSLANSGGDPVVSALNSIESSVDSVKTAVNTVNSTLKSIGGFASGGSVQRTGLHQLHAGEFVINPTASNMVVIEPKGDGASAAELASIRTLLSESVEQNRKYQEDDIALTKDLSSSAKEQAEAAYRRNTGRACG